ncbi:MAG TPA: SDR family oxidoreductase [Hypericibacter adhaerens]|uniref:SDR family NAD(P)-dependent oxidoreductase n=1 Tax=Hypericibacter adhaerens TaxID=2602016 RepID=UPI002D11D576|nr:SDR family oxidoreductase [Hypericibacter adhaerens]HWA43967.1 SDR family oxidoreductase [Hypericibacter adhaerens]
MSVFDLFRLDGQVALITGATRGIGLGIAQAFADAGARLVLSSKTPRPEAIEKLRNAGARIDYIQADMQQEAAPARLIAETLKLTGGRLDILVNNAGVAQHGDTETFPPNHYRRLMDINVDAVFRACQAALPTMRAQRHGIILNIGSISGLVSNIPQPQAAYNASKAAVHMLTKSLASDYAGEGIRANAIAPGYIDTDMTSGGLADPVWGPVWRQMTPMPKVGTPADIGAAALYLCSPAAAFVTGEILVVDGGYTIR